MNSNSIDVGVYCFIFVIVTCTLLGSYHLITDDKSDEIIKLNNNKDYSITIEFKDVNCKFVSILKNDKGIKLHNCEQRLKK